MSHLKVLALVVGFAIFSTTSGFIILKETPETIFNLSGDFCALQTLYHGDACSYHAYEKYSNLLQAEEWVQRQELLNEIVLNGELHCNYDELLVCSKRKQKCICGNVWDDEHNAYIREGQVCRVAVEGRCSSDWDENCAEGSTCVIDSDHNLPCTPANEHLSSEGDDKDNSTEIPSRRSCSCQLSTSQLGTYYAYEGQPKEDSLTELKYAYYKGTSEQSRYKRHAASKSRYARAVTPNADNLHKLRILMDVLKVMKLQYGNRCSSYAEDLRTELTKTILKLEYGVDASTIPDELVDEIVEKSKAILLNGDLLCSLELSLICDPVSNTCKCGDPGYNALQIQPPQFIRDGKKCFLPEGSACFHNCIQGTECLGTVDGDHCSIATKKYAEELLEASPRLTFARLIKGMADEKICNCQRDIRRADGPTRYKRDTNTSVRDSFFGLGSENFYQILKY